MNTGLQTTMRNFLRSLVRSLTKYDTEQVLSTMQYRQETPKCQDTAVCLCAQTKIVDSLSPRMHGDSNGSQRVKGRTQMAACGSRQRTMLCALHTLHVRISGQRDPMVRVIRVNYPLVPCKLCVLPIFSFQKCIKYSKYIGSVSAGLLDDVSVRVLKFPLDKHMYKHMDS
jgi:hypothetical protein